MAYSYWKQGRAEEPCVFEMFFRRNPFQGGFAVLAGIHRFASFVKNLRFTEEDVSMLKTHMTDFDDEFYDWLLTVDGKSLSVSSMREGTVVFPREPLVTVAGPLPVVQLIETTLLNLTNFPSLMCTNAVRHRIAAGEDALLVEFGLRRAQGMDAGMMASLYAYVGGFDATSNVQAALTYSLPLRGTHAHSFVQSFDHSALGAQTSFLLTTSGEKSDFCARVFHHRQKLGFTHTHDGELAAFVTFAQSFPNNFVALVDTYNPIRSGVKNFIVVALALLDFGYEPVGIRLDSGNLAHLSVEARKEIERAAKLSSRPELCSSHIMASNDINEDVLLSLHETEHNIDSFGIGTNLVTCQSQPALGCVFKLVEVNSSPRMKLSTHKTSLPCRKNVYRIFNEAGLAEIDVLTLWREPAPKTKEKHVFWSANSMTERIAVVPFRVETMHQELCIEESAEDIRQNLRHQLSQHSEGVKQLHSPKPYGVYISEALRTVLGDLKERQLSSLRCVEQA
eukprot:CAMPEP_0198731022 /NCGR_PEP_ID=MMETSP1475-20131203/27628_1 /TAXON_ID= ORGANISM="Unidentified sp., Strain CCMP1999" /NCGR_SAMPLE_ID=MMETSP1475 /ASSEMBLY_ACC=CAM_ASM_001111 /LENGTH=506 /DNA_ID=CAMNT_0044493923 /DNA_START=192 /DNA_END=1712 /DNA_ORIENTATION=+